MVGRVLSHPADVAFGLRQDKVADDGGSKVVRIVAHDAHNLVLFVGIIDSRIAGTSDILESLLVFPHASQGAVLLHLRGKVAHCV